MGSVAKYNVTKGISTIATIGTPIIGLVCSSIEMVTPAGKMSITACITCLIVLLFIKDKIAENLKLPSAFITSAIIFALIIMVENILVPLKSILLACMIVSGIDELTFKRIYKQLELLMPEKVSAFKKVGFIFTTTKNLEAIK